MKRLLLLMLSVALVLSSVAMPVVYAEGEVADVAAVADTVVENPYESIQNVLVDLDILAYDSQGVIDNEKEVTRADFVGFAGRFLQINPTVASDKTYFNDVPADAWYTYALNMLVDLKIISQSDDRLFEPDRVITVDEATKIMVSMLGYRLKAEDKGGYPQGYRAVATQEGLYSGLPSGENMTYAHMSVMFYNALDIPMLKMTNNNGEFKYEKDGENILGMYRHIYKIEGVVDTVYGMTLVERDLDDISKIMVDGVTYEVGEISYAMDFFGSKVTVYYELSTDKETRTLKHISQYKKDDRINVKDKDIIDYNSETGKFIYKVERGERTVTIAANATVMRNGSAVASDLREAFNIKNGEATLIDNDGDKKYDVVIIYDYETVVVNTISKETRVISDGILPRTISLNNTDYKYVIVYTPAGDIVDFSYISQGAVVDVAMSPNHAIIHINATSFNGTIEVVNTKDKKVTIDGVEYEYYQDAYDKYVMEPGATGLFKTNVYNKIAYFKGSEDEINVGFMVNVAEGNVFDTPQIKYLDAKQGGLVTAYVSEKLKIDGDKVQLSDMYRKLSNIKRNVIVFELDTAGKISSIDTPNRGENEDDTTLTCVAPLTTTGLRYNSYNDMFGVKAKASKSATVLMVPRDEDVDCFEDEESYSVDKMSNIFSTSEARQVACYKTGPTDECNILVYYKYKYTAPTNNRFVFVTEVAEGMDAQGDRIWVVSGYKQGAVVSYNIPYDCEVIPDRGDICLFGAADKNGKVGNIEIHYDYSRNWSGINQTTRGGQFYDTYGNRNYDMMGGWAYSISWKPDIMGYIRLLPGVAYSINDGYTKIGYPTATGTNEDPYRRWYKPTGSSTNFDELTVLTLTVPIVVYDAATDKFSTGELSDIQTMDIYGLDCSQVFIDLYWAAPRQVMVINNREDIWE